MPPGSLGFLVPVSRNAIREAKALRGLWSEVSGCLGLWVFGGWGQRVPLCSSVHTYHHMHVAKCVCVCTECKWQLSPPLPEA